MVWKAAEMAADAPQANRANREAGQLRQGLVQAGHASRAGVPENDRDQENASHVRDGRRQAQQRRLIGPDVRAQGDGRDQRLAVAGLNRVGCSQGDRNRDEREPRGG